VTLVARANTRPERKRFPGVAATHGAPGIRGCQGGLRRGWAGRASMNWHFSSPFWRHHDARTHPKTSPSMPRDKPC
jgi:hypothetical protein